jgi:hypothetical protein
VQLHRNYVDANAIAGHAFCHATGNNAFALLLDANSGRNLAAQCDAQPNAYDLTLYR